MAAGQLAAGRMEFADRLTGGSWRTRVVCRRGMKFADRLTAAVGGREQYAGDRGSWRPGGSSSSVYRGYYCFYEADGAVLVEEFVLSTAFVRLMEQ